MKDLYNIEKTLNDVVDKLNIYNRCFLTDEEKKDMIKEYKYMINNGEEKSILEQLIACKEYNLVYEISILTEIN